MLKIICIVQILTTLSTLVLNASDPVIKRCVRDLRTGGITELDTQLSTTWETFLGNIRNKLKLDEYHIIELYAGDKKIEFSPEHPISGTIFADGEIKAEITDSLNPMGRFCLEAGLLPQKDQIVALRRKIGTLKKD